MYHKSLTNLNTLTNSEIKVFLNSFDIILTDCDGVLWLENEVIENANIFLNKMRACGKKIYFVTNNSQRMAEEFIAKAKRLGFVCNDDEMLATAPLAARYCQRKDVKKAYVMGSLGIIGELAKLGIEGFGDGPDTLLVPLEEYMKTFRLEPDVGAVIVGFDEHISYIKILKAASYLRNPDCLFIATNTDENFPTNEWNIPGTGSIVAAVATSSCRKPIVMGKPNLTIVEDVVKGVDPRRILMIGDRSNTDILLGTKGSFQTLLVLSGVTNLAETQNWKTSGIKEELDLVSDFYIDNLGDLVKFL